VSLALKVHIIIISFSATFSCLHLFLLGKVEYSDEPLDYRGTFRNKTVLLTNKKARNLLGWSPRHLGVLAELDIFYHTIKGTSY